MLRVLLAAVVADEGAEVAPTVLLVAVRAVRGFVAGKPVEVRVVADPVLAGPDVGLGAAVAGVLAGAGALAGAGGLAEARGFAVADFAVAVAEVLAVMDEALLVAVEVVEVIGFFWVSVVFASPLTVVFFSASEGTFLSVVALLATALGTLGDLLPIVDSLAVADGAVVVGGFFVAVTVVVLAAVAGFTAGLVNGLAAVVAFFAAAPAKGALAVFVTALATACSGVGVDLGTVGSSLVAVFCATASSTTGLTSSNTGSLTMVGTESAETGSFATVSGTCSNGVSFSKTHKSSTATFCATGSAEIGAS